MKVFLILYDLRKVGQNYSSLYDGIKSFTTNWQHPMESLWFVKVPESITAQNIFDKLQSSIDENDKLFIININDPKERQGWMPKTFWPWLGQELT